MQNYIERLKITHAKHIAHYGDRLEERLTGTHETSAIHEFSVGEANRGSSIRIPRPVVIKGYMGILKIEGLGQMLIHIILLLH